MRVKAVLVLLVSVLFFVQCKKKEEVAPADTGEKVRLEIKASWGGEKVGIEDTGLIGVVKWEVGDKIYVGHESGWLGELVASEVSGDGKTASFSGAITTPTGSTKLHLFYLGNNDLTTNSTESVVIDFSDQKTGTLDDIADRFHIAYAETTFDGTGVAQSVIMKNKISIIKFDLSNFVYTDNLGIMVGEPVYMHGEDLSSELVINCDGTIARKGNKVIQLGWSANKLIGETGEILTGATKYVALIPNDLPMDNNLSKAAKSGKMTLRFDSNHFLSQHVMNNGIVANGFYGSGDAKEAGDPVILQTLDVTGNDNNYRVTPGLFFVDEAKTQMVRFSRQNLSVRLYSDYVGKSSNGNNIKVPPTQWYWYFGDNDNFIQYKIIGSLNNTIVDVLPEDRGWYDMFCFGTTGYNNCSPFNYQDNPELYWQSNLLQSTPPSGTGTGPSDWGSVAGRAEFDRSIGLKYNDEFEEENFILCDGWRTLSESEWNGLYRVHGNSNLSKEVLVKWFARHPVTYIPSYGKALLPIEFNDVLTSIEGSYILSSLSPTSSPEMTSLTHRGLIFLPYSGFRKIENDNVQMYLYADEVSAYFSPTPAYTYREDATKYWTSTFASGTKAKAFSVRDGVASDVSITTGLAVRLVRNIEEFHKDELSLTPTFSN